MGIFGNWGSGKTSLMKTIESRVIGLFFPEDINTNHIYSLVHNLYNKTDNISSQLWKQFSKASKEKLEYFDKIYYGEKVEASNSEIEKTKRILINELNLLLEKPNMLDKKYFSQIHLTDETKKFVRRNSRRKEHIIQLNRSLLEDIYQNVNSNLLFPIFHGLLFSTSNITLFKKFNKYRIMCMNLRFLYPAFFFL